MASDENPSMIISPSTVADEYSDHDHDTDDGYDHHPHPHNLSRLSVCTSSMITNEEDEDDYQDCDGMRMFMSRLSIESFDADEELSDDAGKGGMLDLDLSSDSEPGCYSLPATPPRRRNLGASAAIPSDIRGKDYASENDAAEKVKLRKNSRRRRRVVRERWMMDGENEKNWGKIKKDEQDQSVANSNSFSGESEGSGLMVITRPKGGRRTLCMDLDEVKACRDLGFELEHERMLEMPNRVSLSASTLETSSGGNSPIANWRISSPGDDPRDVKARLKVWAQAVAIVSTSRHGGF
ncbi:hypothetical protein M5689_004664 [Euphorbia peplus]|nr:hypothetical protein M5689_004664 [Euphorbia peplus]